MKTVFLAVILSAAAFATACETKQEAPPPPAPAPAAATRAAAPKTEQRESIQVGPDGVKVESANNEGSTKIDVNFGK